MKKLYFEFRLRVCMTLLFLTYMTLLTPPNQESTVIYNISSCLFCKSCIHSSVCVCMCTPRLMMLMWNTSRQVGYEDLYIFKHEAAGGLAFTPLSMQPAIHLTSNFFMWMSAYENKVLKSSLCSKHFFSFLFYNHLFLQH